MKSFRFREFLVALALGLNLFAAAAGLILCGPLECRIASSLDGRWLERQANFVILFYHTAPWYWLTIPALALLLWLFRKRRFYPMLLACYLLPLFWLLICLAVYAIGLVTMSGTWTY